MPKISRIQSLFKQKIYHNRFCSIDNVLHLIYVIEIFEKVEQVFQCIYKMDCECRITLISNSKNITLHSRR